jgi:hypothetical protein
MMRGRLDTLGAKMAELSLNHAAQSTGAGKLTITRAPRVRYRIQCGSG